MRTKRKIEDERINLKKTRIGIVGATGYTASESLKLLLRHPHVELTRLTSRSDIGTPAEKVHPSLRGQVPLEFTEYSLEDFRGEVDVAFCCLPHAASSPIVKELADAGIRVIDFSADYRLDDLGSFETWYKAEHADPSRIGRVPYGLPEWFRDQIRTADVVANPGCFPTTAILALAPLVKAGLIDPEDIVVDSKTGVSGGGRTPKLNFHFPECNESVAAYGVGTHRHWPEINQIVGRISGCKTGAIFTPHLIPMDRGILSTIYVRPEKGVTPAAAQECLASAYRREPFVRVTSELPATKDVSGTNFCDLAVRQLGNRLVLISVIDNLIKGASGAAVQNLNVMCGYPETLALL